jgi:hypothetical protein
MKAATILQNLVPLKLCCLMLITEGRIAEVRYLCPSTCLPVTVGTKRGCLRNSELPLAWYKPHPLFPLSIALMDYNSFKPLYIYIYTHTHTHTHTHTWHSFLPVTSCPPAQDAVTLQADTVYSFQSTGTWHVDTYKMSVLAQQLLWGPGILLSSCFWFWSAH